MKTLAEFLAKFICKTTTFNKNYFIKEITKGIEAYKKHLQEDSPKTVHWTMIEKDLITALERMQCKNNLEDVRHNNQNEEKHKLDCAIYNNPSAKFASNVSDYDYGYKDTNKKICIKCNSNNVFQNNELIKCLDCGALINIEETKIIETKDIKHPICPLNLYFEGDENKIDLNKCDFKNRGCSIACKLQAERNENGSHYKVRNLGQEQKQIKRIIKMPYITQEARKNIDKHFQIQNLLSAIANYNPSDLITGNLNYIITKIIHEWIKRKGLRYENINAAIGVLDCVKIELYRSIAVSYEDEKIKENGCISELDGNPDEYQKDWK